MGEKNTVPLTKLIEDFKLEVVYEPNNLADILISSTDVNRPGIQLAAGYFDYFDNTRIQILGKVEHSFLENLSASERFVAFDNMLSYGIPAVIITRGLPVYEELMDAAKRRGIPVLRTQDSTSYFMAALIASLNTLLAPCVTRHGVLVEVYGEGVLLLGESGVGKSETAVELVKRGHRLVADDAVDIRRVSAKTLVGSAPEIIRHFIELRGVGIIDVKKIFGVGSVKDTEKIDLIIHLENWQQGKQYERLGLKEEYTNILGINIPSIVVPVRPGRNLAIIVEIAAMNNRQKKMGYNAAEELNERLIKQMSQFSSSDLV